MHKVAKHITEYELRLELVGKYFRRDFPSDTLIYFPAILLIQLKGLYLYSINYKHWNAMQKTIISHAL